MSDGRINNRVWQLGKDVNKIQKDIDHLKEVISVPRDEYDACVSPRETSEQEHDTAQGQSALKTKVPPSPSNRSQTNKPWYKTLNGWKVLFELIAIPFAIGYAVVTFCQWQDLRHNFQVDERALIKAKPTKDITGLFVNNSPVPWSGSPPLIFWPITMTNIGKSVAVDIHADGVLELLDRNQPPSFSYSPHTTMDIAAFYPQDIADFTVPFGPINAPQKFTKEQYDGLMSGNSYLAVFAEITYKDQFGQHWARSCDWMGASTGPKTDPLIRAYPSRPCVDWNTFGDGAPPDRAALP